MLLTAKRAKKIRIGPRVSPMDFGERSVEPARIRSFFFIREIRVIRGFKSFLSWRSWRLERSGRLRKLIGLRPTFRGVPPVAVRGSVFNRQDAKSAKKDIFGSEKVRLKSGFGGCG
jgi:hypothetical protein